jgi:hypothetical protein
MGDVSQDGRRCGRPSADHGHFEERSCVTDRLQIQGWTRQAIPEPSLRVCGADAPALQEIARQEPALAEKIHPELPYIGAEVVWAVRSEMARTVVAAGPGPCCRAHGPALKPPQIRTLPKESSRCPEWVGELSPRFQPGKVRRDALLTSDRMALTPPDLVRGHLNLDDTAMAPSDGRTGRSFADFPNRTMLRPVRICCWLCLSTLCCIKRKTSA